MSGINGVTVGTPTSPRRIKEAIKPVLTVNSLPPDENGNVVVQGGSGGSGGVTFVPTVSVDGVLSWTNNGGLTNPTPVDITGPAGPAGGSPTLSVQTKSVSEGVQVTMSVTQADGTGISHTFIVPRGATGPEGPPGKDGMSFVGPQGPAGDDGVGIAGIGYAQSNDDDGVNLIDVYLTDGQSYRFPIKNGSKGSDGYTPVAGEDYFTPEDKAELVTAVLAALPAAEGAKF